jgi:cell cycle sensor histidine kinase DivJ
MRSSRSVFVQIHGSQGGDAAPPEKHGAGTDAGLHLAFAVLSAGAAAFALGSGADAASVGLMAALCALPVLAAGIGALVPGIGRDLLIAAWGVATAGLIASAGAGGPMWIAAPLAPLAARLSAPSRPVWDAAVVAAVAAAAGGVAGWLGPLAGGALVAAPWFAAATALFALVMLGAAFSARPAPVAAPLVAAEAPAPAKPVAAAEPLLQPPPTTTPTPMPDVRLGLIDLGHEARLLLDPDGLVTASAGPVATRLGTLIGAGQSPGEALQSDADRSALADLLAEARAGRDATGVVRLAAPAGRRVELTASPVPGGTGLVVRDVEAAVAAAETAQARLADRTRWIGELGHEMRTPLNAIIGFSDTMAQGLFGPLPERYAEYPAIINREGRHLLELVNDTLDFARLESGRATLSLTDVDVAAMAAQALDGVRPAAREAGVALSGPVLAGEGTAIARGDARSIRQIITNLAMNAVRYTPSGGSVSLRLAADGDTVRIEVEDTGVGIPKDVLDTLGESFTTGDAVPGRARGTGLGLALVRRLVALQGGRLRIETAPGAGTLAEVRLPAGGAGAAG